MNRASAADENDLAVYTVSQVCVQAVLKGGVNEGDMLAVKQPGNYLNDPERSLKKIDGYLKKGDRQLLFLREYETSPYSMLNTEQGGMRVEEDGALYSASEYALFRRKTNGTGEFVTLEDAVLQIQEALE